MPVQQGFYLWQPNLITTELEARLVISDGITGTIAAFNYIPRDYYEPSLVLLSDAAQIMDTGQILWSAKDSYGRNRGINISLSNVNNTERHILVSDLYGEEYRLDKSKLAPGAWYLVKLEAPGGAIREVLPVIPLNVPALPFQEPRLEVELPFSTVTWTLEHEITWVTDDPLGRSLSIQVDLSADGGITWETVAREAESTGSYNWDTTQYPNGLYMLRVTASNERASTSRTSAPIRLVNRLNDRPVVSLLQPQEREWSGSKTLRWITRNQNNLPGLATILYSTDHGHTWQPIVVAIPDTGSYVLDTNMLPNGDQVWLKVMVTDGRYTGLDTFDAPIRIVNYRNPFIVLNTTLDNQGTFIISWKVYSVERQAVQVSMMRSLDGGLSWTVETSSLPLSGSLSLDATSLPGESSIIIRILATDRQAYAFATFEPVHFASPSTFQPVFEP